MAKKQTFLPRQVLSAPLAPPFSSLVTSLVQGGSHTISHGLGTAEARLKSDLSHAPRRLESLRRRILQRVVRLLRDSGETAVGTLTAANGNNKANTPDLHGRAVVVCT